MDQPSILVRILHFIPHVNITFRKVNDTFNPDSEIYIESLSILASIPAALLILSLLGLLLYLLTRCCDRKPRKSSSQSCQNCTLVTITLLCCAAIGLGLYGNDDFHNGLLQAFNSGKQVETLVGNLKKQTESIKFDLEAKVQIYNLDEMIDKPNYNLTAVTILLDTCRLFRDNTSRAITSLDMVLYFMKTSGTEPDISLKNILYPAELYESIRWPATLGFLTILLLLCTILVIGVARRSRCALIFFSVFGLFGIIICWLLAGIYLASSVAVADFCMKPYEFMCRQVGMKSPDDVYYLNCGTLRNRFILRLNESKDFVERAKESVHKISRMSREANPRINISHAIENIDKELEDTKRKLSVLTGTLDRRLIDKHYEAALKGICGSGLFGLSLMMVAGLLTSFLLTILVYCDSHAWIYLTKKQPDVDKSETTPLFPTAPAPTLSPTITTTGTSTINRTLLHHQQNHFGTSTRNGTTGLRGLASSYNSGGESPPPGYDVVVHGTRSSGHHTLGRLPSQQPSLLSGPNNGKYATLSKQCKTLESSDFY